MKIPRPSWRHGFRKQVIKEQDGKCMWCGEKIKPKDSELHHDYKGDGWSEIKQVAKDALPALGFNEKQIKELMREQYHHPESVVALHPKCHVKADKKMHEGKLFERKVSKA